MSVHQSYLHRCSRDTAPPPRYTRRRRQCPNIVASGRDLWQDKARHAKNRVQEGGTVHQIVPRPVCCFSSHCAGQSDNRGISNLRISALGLTDSHVQPGLLHGPPASTAAQHSPIRCRTRPMVPYATTIPTTAIAPCAMRWNMNGTRPRSVQGARSHDALGRRNRPSETTQRHSRGLASGKQRPCALRSGIMTW
jgi:hypothetical protein